jgi:hypothetical protein
MWRQLIGHVTPTMLEIFIGELRSGVEILDTFGEKDI